MRNPRHFPRHHDADSVSSVDHFSPVALWDALGLQNHF